MREAGKRNRNITVENRRYVEINTKQKQKDRQERAHRKTEKKKETNKGKRTLTERQTETKHKKNEKTIWRQLKKDKLNGQPFKSQSRVIRRVESDFKRKIL